MEVFKIFGSVIFSSMGAICFLPPTSELMVPGAVVPGAAVPGAVVPEMVIPEEVGPEVADCRNITYTPKYSLSCTELFRLYGGDNEYFEEEYPCCLCSEPDGLNCISARGGYAVRNVGGESVCVQEVLTRVVVASTAVMTNQTDFNSTLSVVSGVLTPDCDCSEFCVNKCLSFSETFGTKLGLSMLNDVHKCCYCGEPLFGGCYNCFCAKGSNYLSLKGQVSSLTVAGEPTLELPEAGAFLTAITEVTCT